MLFPYQYVPHQMERMQEFIDFIFDEVWCKAPGNGPFSLDLFDGNADLKEVMTAFNYGDTQGGDFFYSHVERIYAHFAALTPAQIDQFKLWYKANNDIENVCINDPALSLVRYSDLISIDIDLIELLATFFKGLYSQQLLNLAVLKSKIGDIDSHYRDFIQKNRSKCPFCGIADMQGVYESYREAYDHYLPKSLYPFNTINFKNLVPACHHCNSTYKTSKDPVHTPKDPAHAITRRKIFYPYTNDTHSISIKIELKTSDLDHLKPQDIEFEFGPPALTEEIETWKDVYSIEDRFKNKCCSEDAKDWMEQVRTLRELGLNPEAFLIALNKQTAKDPFANENFLKKAFLEGCDRIGILNTFADDMR